MYHPHRKATGPTRAQRPKPPHAQGASAAAVPAPPRRCAWAIAVASLSAFLAAFAFAASPALAGLTHVYDPTTTANFGSEERPLGVAVDQASGDVYVTQRNGLYKLSAAGKPVSSFGGGTGVVSLGFDEPWGVAVDQASHDVYVTSEILNTVFKFDSEGNPVASFGTEGHLSVPSPIGVAVDPTNGNLYVASHGQSKVHVFTSSDAPVTEFSSAPAELPLGVAVDSSGRVYVDGGGYTGGAAVLARFDESGTSEGLVETGAFQGVTVDPNTQDVYATQEGELFQYGPGGESLITEFGAGIVDDAWGIAVNETTGEVYAATYAGRSIQAFGPLVILADVTTEPPLPANLRHKTATLTGHIDLAGGPEVTECDIEYGTNTEYSSGKIPCEATLPITGPTAISGTLPGLIPMTTYHYRFAAKNENGTGYGQDQTVETPAVLGVNTGAATGVTTRDANTDRIIPG